MNNVTRCFIWINIAARLSLCSHIEKKDNDDKYLTLRHAQRRRFDQSFMDGSQWGESFLCASIIARISIAFKPTSMQRFSAVCFNSSSTNLFVERLAKIAHTDPARKPRYAARVKRHEVSISRLYTFIVSRRWGMASSRGVNPGTRLHCPA